MNRTRHRSWIVCAILAGMAYAIIGKFFPNPDLSVGAQTQLLWRLGAWILSAVVFFFHIGYEHFRLRSSPLTTALHTTAAVAFGAFLLAGFALIRATSVAVQAPLSRYVLALVLWPAFTGVPAFIVSIFLAALLSRLPRNRLAE